MRGCGSVGEGVYERVCVRGCGSVGEGVCMIGCGSVGEGVVVDEWWRHVARLG